MKKTLKDFVAGYYPNTEIAIGYIARSNLHFEGFRNTGSGVLEVDNSTKIFEIGSITKVFTTTILAQLIHEGIASEKTPISSIIPHKQLQETNLNLLNLANHTSGLPRLPDNFYSIVNYDEKNPYRNYDEVALLDYLENNLLQSLKSTGNFEYSNLGSGLLGYALGKMAGAPFQVLVKDKIFLPLNMDSSTFDSTAAENSVAGLNQTGGQADHWEGGILSGCIGMRSSVVDMTKFISFMLDEKNPIANLQLKETHVIETNHFMGMGWGIRVLSDGSKSYNHGGGSAGYSAYLKMHRASQTGIIFLTNISAFHEHQATVNEMATALFDELRNSKISGS